MNRLLQNAMNDYEWLNEATMDVLLICFNLIVTWVSYSLEMMIDHYGERKWQIMRDQKLLR